MPLLINNDLAKALLTMEDCIGALEEAYREEGEGSGTNRTKSNIQIPTENPDYWYRYCSMEEGLRKAGVVGIRGACPGKGSGPGTSAGLVLAENSFLAAVDGRES